MKKINLHKLSLTLLIIAIIICFVYSLIFMTDVNNLYLFNKYLKPEVLLFTNESLKVNNFIFYTTLGLIILLISLYLTRYPKKITIYNFIYCLIVSGIILIFEIIFLIKNIDINNQFNNLDISWNSQTLSQEIMGYVESNNNFINIGNYLLIVSILLVIISIILNIKLYLIKNKGKV